MAKAKKKAAKKTRTVARSAKTGKFVKKSYAKKHPSTTEVQRVPASRAHRSYGGSFGGGGDPGGGHGEGGEP